MSTLHISVAAPNSLRYFNTESLKHVNNTAARYITSKIFQQKKTPPSIKAACLVDSKRAVPHQSASKRLDEILKQSISQDIEQENSLLASPKEFLKAFLPSAKEKDEVLFNDLELIPAAPPVPLMQPQQQKKKHKKKTLISSKTSSPIPPVMGVADKKLMKRDIPGHVLKTLEEFHKFFSYYCVIDTEATGLGNHHKLIDVGAVMVRNFVQTGQKFQMYINPECDVNYTAYQLTGLSRFFLQAYPTADVVCEEFLKFLNSYPLIIHHAHFDLKLLNKQGNRSVNIEDGQVIIDTERFMKETHPDKKTNLSASCEHYGVDITKRTKHGALIDAELTADLFCKMIRAKDSKFPSDVKWEYLPRINIEQDFAAADTLLVVDFFYRLGIHSIPKTLRYCSNLYHPDLRMNFPGILFPFKNTQGEVKGVLVRYIISDLPAEINPEEGRKKYFYGSAENAVARIQEGDPSVLFLSDTSTALILNDLLQSQEKEKIYSHLKIETDPSISGILDYSLLTTLDFENSASRIILVQDITKTNDFATIREEFLKRFFATPKISPVEILMNQHSLLGYKLNYENTTWTVHEDTSTGMFRILILTDNHQATSVLTFSPKDLKLCLNGVYISPMQLTFNTPQRILYWVKIQKNKDNSIIQYKEKLIQALCSCAPVELETNPTLLELTCDIVEILDAITHTLPPLAFLTLSSQKITKSSSQKKQSLGVELQTVLKELNRFQFQKYLRNNR